MLNGVVRSHEQLQMMAHEVRQLQVEWMDMRDRLCVEAAQREEAEGNVAENRNQRLYLEGLMGAMQNELKSKKEEIAGLRKRNRTQKDNVEQLRVLLRKQLDSIRSTDSNVGSKEQEQRRLQRLHLEMLLELLQKHLEWLDDDPGGGSSEEGATVDAMDARTVEAEARVGVEDHRTHWNTDRAAAKAGGEPEVEGGVAEGHEEEGEGGGMQRGVAQRILKLEKQLSEGERREAALSASLKQERDTVKWLKQQVERQSKTEARLRDVSFPRLPRKLTSERTLEHPDLAASL
eukprot:829481-Rhodomonas_salina.1